MAQARKTLMRMAKLHASEGSKNPPANGFEPIRSALWRECKRLH